MPFCSRCGKENQEGSCFCAYCGTPFKNIISIQNEGELKKEEIDLIYYKANLQMQQETLRLQQQELEEKKKQNRLQEEQLRLQEKQYKKMAKCPRCGSTSLSTHKKGYGIGKGIVGAAVAGPLGLMAGNIGSGKVMVTCLNCGYKFKMTNKWWRK